MEKPTNNYMKAPIALALGLGSFSYADFVVDEDLGTLADGVTQIMGTTVGGPNNAQNYRGLTNTAAFWGAERVFQFTLTQPSDINLTSVALTGDPDFFIIGSLTTEFDGVVGGQTATDAISASFLDAGPPETAAVGILAPGTYYLVVDNYDDFAPAGSTFTLDIEVTLPEPPEPVEPPADFTDLGNLAAADTPLIIDTFGSDFDTELGVYNSFGTLILANDDAGGVLQSELPLDNGLADGVYYFAIGGYDTTYADGFEAVAAATSAAGNFTINYPLQGTPTTETGSLATAELLWYRFTIGNGGGGPVTGDDITITSVAFNPATNQFTVTWDSSAAGPFNIHGGTPTELEVASGTPSGLMELIATGATSPAVIDVPAEHVGDPSYFIQVAEAPAP